MRRSTRQTTTKPSLMQRLKGNHGTTTRTTKHSHNPITGTESVTTTEKTTNHDGYNNGVAGTSTTGSKGSRSFGPRNRRTARTSGTTTTSGHHHHHHQQQQQRRPSIGDKVSGAMMKLKGSLTHRPGEKGAGTRRMHGTDGRGSTRVY